jgi:hypothetical protein
LARKIASPPARPKPAATPDALIASGKDGRIRLIEKRPPRQPVRRPTGR